MYNSLNNVVKYLKMKSTIYFDIDGIILDFNLAFVQFWNEGLKSAKWKGHELFENPTNWDLGTGLNPVEIDLAMNTFYETHDHLPLMDANIPTILNKLRLQYYIVFVSGYPNHEKRVRDLAYHKIEYDELHTNIHDKLSFYIKNQNVTVAAIFEDAPHHIRSLLSFYPNLIWSPAQWNYLQPYHNHHSIVFYKSVDEWLKI